MGISGIMIKGYSMRWQSLTKKFYDEKTELYNSCVIVIRIREMNKGMKLHRMNKPTRNGTTMSFQRIESKEEYDRELLRLEEDAKKIDIKILEENLRRENLDE